ncbi:hypothetical protein [Bdellovibrio sp. KM01]|uniref:hypothetical protein n=1 Tax=Bdellovibrio sp. KM01 TaxID=2748865 RepID=UPI0015E92280|nr:hypothetical protein [Bdellovibrio sp. KM01]QLY27082.1 hypothetical protein HW988_08850 [Bdellovibrio sp. KM01]
MKALILLTVLVLANVSWGSTKYVLMMSHESSSEMPYSKSHEYCHKLESVCESKTQGPCDDKVYAKWVVPAKEELDQLSPKHPSARFIWTKSKLYAVGDGLPAVYRFSSGGSYGPSYGKNHRVRCVKFTAI